MTLLSNKYSFIVLLLSTYAYFCLLAGYLNSSQSYQRDISETIKNYKGVLFYI